ncbi:MAG: amidohydrolase family protein [Phyllobacterium sp.]
MVIEDGRITAVGSTAEIREKTKPGVRTIDLAGHTVVPGLIDGHAHMDREGLKQALPSLADARSIADVLASANSSRKLLPGEWIITMPIGDPPEFENVPQCLKENRFPTRWELDKVSPTTRWCQLPTVVRWNWLA